MFIFAIYGTPLNAYVVVWKIENSEVESLIVVHYFVFVDDVIVEVRQVY